MFRLRVFFSNIFKYIDLRLRQESGRPHHLPGEHRKFIFSDGRIFGHFLILAGHQIQYPTYQISEIRPDIKFSIWPVLLPESSSKVNRIYKRQVFLSNICIVLTLSGPRFFRYRKDREGGGMDSTPPSILLKIGG